MRRMIIIAFALIMNGNGIGQPPVHEYYIPVNLVAAYAKGTRSYDGRPGMNYWQNRADYEIKADFIPSRRLIRGEEHITYYNNSPDTLKELVVRLYQDMYKKGAIRDYELDARDLHEGVDVIEMIVGDYQIVLDDNEPSVTRRATNLSVKLEDPIPPGEVEEIYLAWHARLPRVTPVRSGAYTDSAFFVGYWYPQLAVYDDIDGWDRNIYSGIQEFYTEFGDFEVQITAPGDYLIWATGEFENPEDVLTSTLLQRLRFAMEHDSVVCIVDPSDSLLMGNLTLGTSNTWRFTAENVPDFAFAASNYYRWDATSMMLGSGDPRRVFIQAVYPEDSPDFQIVARMAREIIHEFSNFLPGVPYPYAILTAFNRGGNGSGMEFPMMINDGSYEKETRTLGLTAHEIAHMYFPFHMGTNERKYAWMDEGWAVMLTDELQAHFEPATDPFGVTIEKYVKSAGKDSELPMMIPSVQLRGETYGMASYTRPAVAYHLLQNYLGKDMFKQGIHEYIYRWNGKHPTPYDFYFTFDQIAGEKLDWFWKPWFFDNGYPDLAIKTLYEKDNQRYLVIERLGDFPVPVYAKVYYSDNGEELIEESMSVWKNGKREIELRLKYNVPVRKVELGHSGIPDIENKNNIFEP